MLLKEPLKSQNCISHTFKCGIQNVATFIRQQGVFATTQQSFNSGETLLTTYLINKQNSVVSISEEATSDFNHATRLIA